MSDIFDRELEWVDGDWDEPFHNPIMVIALKGPFDAATGATGAVRHLISTHKAKPYARIDSDGFFDFTGERPVVRILKNTGKRTLQWPDIECRAVRLDGKQHDLLLLKGTEPHLRWKAFVRYVFEIADRAQVERIVTLGSFAGIEPHTRSSGVGGSTSHNHLTKELGLSSPTYQGPTGAIGVLSTWAQGGSIPVISLRVSVPDYATSVPSPEASRSLLARLELITGVQTGYASLESSATEWRKQLDRAVEENEDLADYVGRLEERIDESDDLLPSGEDLGAQIEAYLRRDNARDEKS